MFHREERTACYHFHTDCFTAGDSLEEVIENVLETVEGHLHGAKSALEASTIDKYLHDPKTAVKYYDRMVKEVITDNRKSFCQERSETLKKEIK